LKPGGCGRRRVSTASTGSRGGREWRLGVRAALTPGRPNRRLSLHTGDGPTFIGSASLSSVPPPILLIEQLVTAAFLGVHQQHRQAVDEHHDRHDRHQPPHPRDITHGAPPIHPR
jgi:hypothetical protein